MSNSDTNFPFTHFLIAAIFSLLVIAMSATRHFDWFTAPTTALMSPLRYPFSQLNRLTAQQFNFLKDIPNQQRLIKDLERQNATLAVTAGQNQQLLIENEALRKIIHAPVSTGRRLLPVRVVALSRFAYIDHGSNDGLKKGQPAVVDSLFLGIIDAVSANSARLMLLTDSDLVLPVTTSLKATGTLRFDNNQLVITEVLQKQPLQVDDRVFTTGSEQIPGNLLIGTVTEIETNQSSVFQTAVIKPATTLSDHRTLFVALD